MEDLSVLVIVIFGLFLIYAGFLMFFKPEQVRIIIAKAGSTYFINYAELLIRMFLGFCFLFASKHSLYEFYTDILGYFLIVSAALLMLLPIKKHNQFSRNASEFLKPIYLKLSAPFSIFFGVIIIYIFLNK